MMGRGRPLATGLALCLLAGLPAPGQAQCYPGLGNCSDGGSAPQTQPIPAPAPSHRSTPERSASGPSWKVKASVSQGYQNVRSGPGTMHPVLFAIPARSGGIRMMTCRRPDAGGGRYDWCQIEWKGQIGWSSVNGFEPEF